jgi:serine/threonine protein kinase
MPAAAPPRAVSRSGNALPDGARLGEFEIRSVIGEGGFGIVYLAWDHLLHRQVAIKEYMPSTLATRSLTTTDVTPRSEKFAETFHLGLRSFINEAQLLASFDHPSLLKVYRFWEANGTAYMVMPFYQGTTLKRALNALNAPPDERWLLTQLGHLLDALDEMHQAHCYHRDIAPDNILLLDDGRPLLLDFGAARRVIGDSTQALTAFLKPGYAPVEQYAEMPSMKQGAWTDLYALGSVVHYAVMGHTPPESVARVINDTMLPLQRAAAGRYSERFLRAIDHALGVRPQDRPQSAAEMRAELGIQQRVPKLRTPGAIPTAPQPLDSRPASLADDDDATRPPVRSSTVPPPSALRVPEAAVELPSVRAPRRAGALWLGAALMAPALGFVGWWVLRPAAPPGVPARDVAAPRAPAPAPTAPAPPAPTPATAPSATDAAPVEPAPPRIENTVPEAAKAPPLDAPASAAVAASAAGPQAAAPAPPAAEERPAPSRGDTTKPQRPVAPKLNSPNPRCAEIIARVSLGEPLTSAERAILQGECR